MTKTEYLRLEAKRLALENHEITDKYTDSELAGIYNGLGPDFFPESLRKFTDSLFPAFEPAAMIHDLEWHDSDGTRTGFANSNSRLERNLKKSADDTWPWWNPKRYIMRARAERFAIYCDLFGWSTWRKNAAKNN